MTITNKLGKTVAAGLLSLVAACTKEPQPQQPNKAAYEAVDKVYTGSSYLVDLNGDRIVDLEIAIRDKSVDFETQSSQNVFMRVAWVAPDMVNIAKEKGYDCIDNPTVSPHTPRMSPELRVVSTDLFRALQSYRFAVDKKRFEDYQASLKKN